MLNLTAPDWGTYYLYLTELARENTIDLPENVENWSTKKMLSKIKKIEAKYGKLRPII
ncbi:hypothetical protein P4661_27495 [Priestia megaterium]|uniref:hypothetical protein n=1 Tax=Priestia megaterium TaxID=1404 RepID=UPI002E218628|nr:hypothetical protein [Priestia megaterium]